MYKENKQMYVCVLQMFPKCASPYSDKRKNKLYLFVVVIFIYTSKKYVIFVSILYFPHSIVNN